MRRKRGDKEEEEEELSDKEVLWSLVDGEDDRSGSRDLLGEFLPRKTKEATYDTGEGKRGRGFTINVGVGKGVGNKGG